MVRAGIKLHIYLPLFAICVLLAATGISPRASAAASPWLLGTPTIQNPQVLPAGQLPSSTNGNRDCTIRKVITRPARDTPYQTEESRTGCLVDTGFGAYGAGFLQRQGTTIAGPLKTKLGGEAALLPIPRSGDALLFTGTAAHGSYTVFVKNLDSYLRTYPSLDGRVEHRMTADTPYYPLKDVSGQLLPVAYDSIAFSADGSWMLADIPFIGYARISVATGTVLPFGEPVNYNNGNPFWQAAISPDGRYAITASKDVSVLRIFDLSTCQTVPTRITARVNCQSRDLKPFFQQQMPGYYTATKLRFRSNYTIEMYVSTRQGTNTTTAKLFLTAEGQQKTGYQYLALGDSFASGEGAYYYKAATDIAENKCHVSLRAYPFLISSELGYGQSESVACSGAKMVDVWTEGNEYEGQFLPKIEYKLRSNVDEIRSSFIPGLIPQTKFIDRLSPNIITVSVIGNDIGFADIIKRCMNYDTCYENIADLAPIYKNINNQFDRLTELYAELLNKSPGGKIYALGYPILTDPEGNCAANVHLNKAELYFANNLVTYLNGVVKLAADKAGVFYVDVSHAFDGHRFCETKSTDIAVNGVTFGDDATALGVVPIGKESFHPNALGHKLYKDTILAKTNNFTAPMPLAQSDLQLPKPQDLLPSLSAALKLDTLGPSYYHDAMGADLAVRESTWQGSTDTTTPLKPDSSVSVVINSTPTHLGNYTVGADGSVDFTVTIPAGIEIEPGFHTMHVYGTNVAGEAVDIQKVVYVAASSTDMDGDGVDDAADPCPAIQQAGVDADKDGVDDACDALIDEPPIEPAPTPAPDPKPPTEPEEPLDEPQPLPEDQTPGTGPPSEPEPTPTTPDPQPAVPPTTAPTPPVETPTTPEPQPQNPEQMATTDTIDPKTALGESAPLASYIGDTHELGVVLATQAPPSIRDDASPEPVTVLQTRTPTTAPHTITPVATSTTLPPVGDKAVLAANDQPSPQTQQSNRPAVAKQTLLALAVLCTVLVAIPLAALHRKQRKRHSRR